MLSGAMTDPLILVIDAGTTSTRALVFDPTGHIVAQASQIITQYFPQPGWVEHDANEIAQASQAVGRAALAQLAKPCAVVAVGITNQRETVVLWDSATGAPLHRAIVWQDRRTADRCDALTPHAALVTQTTGLRLDPYFSASKVAWLLDHVDGVRELPAGQIRAGTIDCYLATLWTGAHITDASNASRTSLYDLSAGKWSPELCDLFGVPVTLLPQVTDSAGQLGMINADIFGIELPLCALIGDQQSAAIGQACISPGLAKITYGTGAFLLVHVGTEPRISAHQLLGTVAWQIAGRRAYALEGSIFVAGSALQWLRDDLGIIGTAEESAAIAASVPDSDGVVFVPAFTGLGAPYWNPQARGLICGLTRGSTKAHIVRACLEAMSHQTDDLLGAFAADGLEVTLLRIDGGMANNDWLMQDLADLLNMPIERPAVVETTAWGAAILASIGAGLHEDMASAGANWRAAAATSPQMTVTTRAARRAQWQSAVKRTITDGR